MPPEHANPGSSSSTLTALPPSQKAASLRCSRVPSGDPRPALFAKLPRQKVFHKETRPLRTQL